MRLSNIKKALDAAPIGQATLSVAPLQGQPLLQVSNIRGFKAFLDSVDAIPALASQVSALKDTWVYATNQNHINFPTNDTTYQPTVQAASDLIRSARVLRDTLQELAIVEQQESISVKLPDEYALKDISETLTFLYKAFAQVIAENPINGELIVSGWETGTLWVVLYLKTLAAVKLVADITRAALIVRQEKLKGDWIERQIHSYDIKNELVSTFADAVNAQVKLLVEHESRAIENKSFDAHDNERQERLKQSIRLLADLAYKGVEIFPSLNAPPEIREAFPDPKSIGTVLSTIQQLEDSPGETTSESLQSAPKDT
jgi:hypothetical protein